MASETSPLTESAKDKSCVLRNIKIITRSLGIFLSTVLWISVVVIISEEDDSFVGYYLIPVAAVVTFFEITWILDKGVCCVREGVCCQLWAGIVWVDTWVKFLLYCFLAIPCFLDDDRIWLAILCGLGLIVLGILYLVKTFRNQVTVTMYKTVTRIKRPKTVVFHETGTQTNDDELEEVITIYTKPDKKDVLKNKKDEEKPKSPIEKQPSDKPPKTPTETNPENIPEEPPGSPGPDISDGGAIKYSEKETNNE